VHSGWEHVPALTVSPRQYFVTRESFLSVYKRQYVTASCSIDLDVLS
jgi:hypothetical protein